MRAMSNKDMFIWGEGTHSSGRYGALAFACLLVLGLSVLAALLLATQSASAYAQTSPKGSTSGPTSAPGAPGQADCSPNWTAVSSPNFDAHSNSLNAVAAVSANNVWAVGSYLNDAGNFQVLTEQWNGSAWMRWEGSNVAGSNYLYGVSAISSSDVWAVGSADTQGDGTQETLAEQWDGTRWNGIETVNFCCSDTLRGVAAISANNVWAVGFYVNNSGTAQTLIEHWNGSTMTIVPSPNAGTHDNFLLGVSASAGNNVWAVGYHLDNSGRGQTLVERWDGTSWSVVSSPNLTYGGLMYGVAARSGTNVWAVGKYFNASNTERTLIEHWDGTSWSQVSSPNATANDNALYAVSAVSATDIWAVGMYVSTSNQSRALIEHWDGTSWSQASSQAVDHADNVVLNGVGVLSGSNAWTAGYYDNDNRVLSQALTKHWDGSAWSIVSTPNIGENANYIDAVAAESSSDVWAVGYHDNPGTGPKRTLIEHWDGTSWSVVTSPNVGVYDNRLQGVATVSSTNVWAVGYYSTSSAIQTLIEHWDGTSWSTVPSLSPGPTVNFLSAVAAVATNDVWAVGEYSDGTLFRTLVERWNGTQWSIVPSSNVGTGENYFDAVSAVSSVDVWAAGVYHDVANDVDQTLIEH